MSAPSLKSYVQGQSVVTGDNLNTFAQTCDTFADLRSFIGLTGVQVYTRGGAAINDGLQGFFYWAENSTAADDNVNTIVPNGAASQGRWIRVQNTSSPAGVSATITASEIITAGSFVNVYSNGGATAVRNANASDPTKFANGYAYTAIASTVAGVITFVGLNANAAVSTPASQVWLSDTVPGGFQTTPPTTTGHIVQSLGVAAPNIGVFFSIQPWVQL